jgi:hypothetical protein
VLPHLDWYSLLLSDPSLSFRVLLPGCFRTVLPCRLSWYAWYDPNKLLSRSLTEKLTASFFFKWISSRTTFLFIDGIQQNNGSKCCRVNFGDNGYWYQGPVVEKVDCRYDDQFACVSEERGDAKGGSLALVADLRVQLRSYPACWSLRLINCMK